MIKGNESDVANICFEISATKDAHNSVTSYPILMWFASICSIFKLPESGVENSKLKIFEK